MEPDPVIVAAGFEEQNPMLDGLAERRLATTQPAEPAPMMMSSYSLVGNDLGVLNYAVLSLGVDGGKESKCQGLCPWTPLGAVAPKRRNYGCVAPDNPCRT